MSPRLELNEQRALATCHSTSPRDTQNQGTSVKMEHKLTEEESFGETGGANSF